MMLSEGERILSHLGHSVTGPRMGSGIRINDRATDPSWSTAVRPTKFDIQTQPVFHYKFVFHMVFAASPTSSSAYTGTKWGWNKDVLRLPRMRMQRELRIHVKSLLSQRIQGKTRWLVNSSCSGCHQIWKNKFRIVGMTRPQIVQCSRFF